MSVVFTVLQVMAIMLLAILISVDAEGKQANRQKDLDAVVKLKPIIEAPNIFFWRPQKVGSSTILSILMSYSYRFNFLPKRKSSSNAYCRTFAKCAIANQLISPNVTSGYLEKYVMQSTPGSRDRKKQLTLRELDDEKLSVSVGYQISLTHEMCNLRASVIADTMACSFSKPADMTTKNHKEVRELFLVREPLNRAISVYYFWGELYKMKRFTKSGLSGMGLDKSHKRKKLGGGGDRRLAREEDEEEAYEEVGGEEEDDIKKNSRKLSFINEHAKLGGSSDVESGFIQGGRFLYHGNETTSPPPYVAYMYANHTIYTPGMPGPSNTWSAFADNLEDALEVVKSDRLCTIVLERLPESLVVASHFLGWSLADVVVTKHRKALSSHPKYTEWPEKAISKLRSQLMSPKVGEYAMYNAAVQKLDERIATLERKGVSVKSEVEKLLALQKRVTEICLDDDYLLKYRNSIKQGQHPQHSSRNKLRDVEQKYVDAHHMFSFNREILMSFDVCGACEAHAMLRSIELGIATSVETALPLAKLAHKHRAGNPNFAKCPSVSEE